MSKYWTLYDIMSNSSVWPTASSCCQHLGFTSPQSMRGDQTENTYSSCCFPSARDWCLTSEDQQKKDISAVCFWPCVCMPTWPNVLQFCWTFDKPLQCFRVSCRAVAGGQDGTKIHRPHATIEWVAISGSDVTTVQNTELLKLTLIQRQFPTLCSDYRHIA